MYHLELLLSVCFGGGMTLGSDRLRNPRQCPAYTSFYHLLLSTHSVKRSVESKYPVCIRNPSV